METVTVTITKEVRIPGTDIILKEGDAIKIFPKTKKENTKMNADKTKRYLRNKRR